MRFSNFKYRLHLNIGKLSDASYKHRGVILMVSVLMFFIDPNVTVTFGSASLAGMGISVAPPQEISLGLFLLAILIYKLIAFWLSVLIESGTDAARAERKALTEYDPSWDAEEHEFTDVRQLVRMEKGEILYKWTIRQILWEFVLPNAVGCLAVIVYVTKYAQTWST